MAAALLATKLHVPRRRRGLVPRPELSQRLDRGAQATLTLVSAPAGFGKTTVLTEWLAQAATGGRPVAWLSLDRRDDDPALFWRYLIAALQTALPGIGAEAGALVQSGQASTEAVVASLVNELCADPRDVVLVLDDYHLIEGLEVQQGMAFLLEHLPEHVQLVIAGRADPALPLARLRARGDLVEVRADDLRFTRDEAAAYLREMGVTLTPEDVATLDDRTEGWIAALQLAALSMRGRDDVAGFIAGFAGDDRYVVDYLVEEVLQRQPDDVREFLLRTSVLTRLTGSLCDAVTGQGGGRSRLDALERGNLFLVPLDDRRLWFRYHHLFADVLRMRLLDEVPDLVPGLHARAGDWFERHGDRPEAISHALAGGDVARAADLIELSVPVLRRDRQEATLRSYMRALPADVFTRRPVLSVGYVGVRMTLGELDGVDALLRGAERWLEAPAAAGGRWSGDRSARMRVVDDEEFRRLPGTIAMYRAGQARLRGDLAGTVAHARRVLDLVDEDDFFRRGAAASLLGLASWTTGDLEAAHRWYAQGMAALEKAGYQADVVGGAVTLADIRIAQGRLSDAMTTYERGLQRAGETTPPLRGAADMHVGMAELHRERGDLDAATRDLRISEELGERAGFPQNPHRWRVAMARMRQVEGDLTGAEQLLADAERLYDGDFSPEARPVPAIRARMWIARGDWRRALGWAAERGLGVGDELSYVREYEHVTLARLLLARYTAERDERAIREATGLLERLLSAAEEGHRVGSVIEVCVLQALAARLHGDPASALPPLRRALRLAEPEGYVRLFLDEGAAMLSLLRAVARDPAVRDPVRRLLSAQTATGERAPVRERLIEPLSERELDVLRLLRSDLSGPDIARELVVSLHTVRTHTNHVYAKLGVHNRRAAVRRAAQLGLFARPPRAPGRAADPDR